MIISKKILIGSAGTGTAFSALMALRRVWRKTVQVVAMDINPSHLVTASLFADHFERVPASQDPAFPTALMEIMGRHGVDTYLPLLPEEISLAAKMKDDSMFPPTIKLMAPPLWGCAACMDKQLLSQIFAKQGIPVPATISASEPPTDDDVFLKPRSGFGSHGVRKIRAMEIKKETLVRPEDWLIQEYCLGPEVTVDTFSESSTGFIRAICRERLEIKAGVTTKARLFEDDTLTGYAWKIAQILDLQGSFCFQVMRNRTGWVVTDVNPRPGAATAMCLMTGNDFFAASFALNWGEDFRSFFKPLPGDSHVTRQYVEFLMGPAG